MAKTIQAMRDHVFKRTGHQNEDLGIYFGSSYWNSVPDDDMINVSDIILLHGNDQSPSQVEDMINKVSGSNSYKSNPKPIVFNEDPNTNFNSNSNNMQTAIMNHASWGYYSQGTNDYKSGYQSPPVDWSVDTTDKLAFFQQVRNYTK